MINLIYRDMPRLSIDIDLVYLPRAERDRSLEDITKNLRGLGESLSKRMTGTKNHW
ncbi:MAG: nucleotidyl transferase AbiEii/AbiGii toxin family protein [Sphaerochaeta sp.]|nr:nucleotidyl transferase AbiEii/AbiGii toxin family protein [Sphaerochaeta sp.]